MLTSSLLITAFSSRYADVIIADSRSSICWFLLEEVPAGFVIANHRLNLSAKPKRCRIHLSKRHRFAIANFKYQLLLPPVDKLTSSTLLLDFFQSAMLTSSLLITAFSSRYADVIIADSRSC
ncbi:hypothetical protein F511_14984 [Dorcoceras hygrometricum]|uniref:Uncharacterized protein n=1 Tax=Dorcoceras hygrometricum TaxID=472368 RepID=A0A2Z7B949_9LAMI|nr:hypothetical protein F511_14984 [Dorcoceras hygrometricum]